MNVIYGVVGANITFGLISGATSTASSVCALILNIRKTTYNGTVDVKRIIKDTDVEVRVKTVQLLLQEIQLSESSPVTLHYCIQQIHIVIQEIADELERIYFRMRYNSNLWFGHPFRAYKFHNCKARLAEKLQHLESRYNTLVHILVIEPMMRKNTELEHVLNAPGFAVEQRVDLHKKLEYIRK
jgi:hypothetical protein